MVAGLSVWWEREAGRLDLIDAAGTTVPLGFDDEAVAALIAYSGGRPITVAGEWDGRSLAVLAAGDGQSWIALPGTESAQPMAATVRSLAARQRRSRAATQAPVADQAVGPDHTYAALVSWAMLGTGRAAPDPVLTPLVERMADRTPEQRLLALMSALTARRRVGRVPQAPLPGIRPRSRSARDPTASATPGGNRPGR